MCVCMEFHVCMYVISLFVDINECTVYNGSNCSHSCVNTNGSYYCTCDEGYYLDDDEEECYGNML